VLARATRNGLAGRVVARRPPVAHPCSKSMEALVIIDIMGAFSAKFPLSWLKPVVTYVPG